MGNPTFITVTDPNYRVGISGGTGDLPLGHGGFIVTDGSGTGTYYEFGLYQQGTFTNVNGANSFSPNGAIRSLTLTGLEYDSSGNVTQQSMQSALDQVFGSSGMYTSDTGMAIASTFSISQQQYDTITQSFIPSQIAGLTSGSERYSISNNDCQQFVLNAATSAGLTVEANQNGSGPALPSLDFVNIEQNASANYQYFGPNSWKGSAIQPDSGFSATLNSLEDAAVQVSEAIGRSTLDIGSRVLKAVSDAIITPANGAEATQTQNGLTVTDGSESYEFIQQTGVNVSASSDGVGTIVDLEGGNTLTAQNSQTVIDAAAATAGGVTVGQADTVNATGATVDVMSQAQATVTGSSNTIVADVNTSVDAVGSNDVIDLSANGGSTLNVSGTGDTVNSIGNSIEFDGSNANLTVNGSDNTFTFSGTNDTLAVEESTLGAGVSQEIDNYSITNSTATLTNSDFNFTDGTSQQELFNPNATTSMEVLNYTGLNETGTLTDETFDFTAGGSQIEFFNPQTGVSLETDSYTGADGGGTLTSSDFNFTGGTSQQELFNPNATTSMEVLNYTGLNETGTLTDETFDFTAGGSQIEFFNPQTGVSLETDNYTGAGGGGTLTSSDFNFTGGTSQQELFNPNATTSMEVLNYTGLNETGTLTDETFDLTAGGSQIEFFNPQTGVSLETDSYTGTDGSGTLTSSDFNFTDGTSQQELFNPNATTSMEVLNYTGLNETGTLTDETFDLTAGGSQIEFFNPQTGVSLETDSYTGADGTGTLTSADFNLTDGTSQQQLFNPQSGVDTEIIDYTGLNESGTVTDKTFDWTAGGSQEQFFNPATGVSEAIENFTGADGGGELSTAVVDRTDGESLDYTFQYNSSGVETDYTVDLFNSSGQQVWAGEYSPTGGYISGSGGYTGPGGTYGGGYGGGYFGGGYDFASGTTAGRGSAGKDISLIAASDASAGKLSASTDHASGHGDDAARRSSDVMALMRGDSGKHGRGGIDIGVIASFDVASGNPAAAHAAEAARLQAEQSAQASSSMQSQMSANFEGAKWSGKTITWSLAEGPGTDALPFSRYLSSAYKPLIEKAFQQWAAASGLTFQEVQDSTSADIRIGWGKFDTATSGVIGYTGYQTSAGQFQPNTIIRLEDPQQDPLVTGKDGQLTYSGTTSELYQVVLHEIGHALGLADNSDPNSIMYYASGPANRTLDHTDVAGIQSLYGAASGAGITTTPTGVSGGANAPASGGGLAALLGSAGGLLSTLAIDQQEPGQGTPNARLTQMIQAMSTVHENGAGWAQEQHTPLAPTPEPAVTVSHPH